jgi:hypothetical protein
MKNIHIFGLLLAGSLALSASAIAMAAAAPSNPARGGAPAAAPAPLVILDFKPAFDDLMTMLVQPRHIKLYLAGQQKNWTLAAFQLNELRGALLRIGQTIPKYRNFSVDATIGSIFQPKIQGVNAAIAAQNPAQFETAFKELTNACNVCHEGMEHPFLVIKVPDAATAAAAYPDQDFRPVAAK